MDIETTGFAPQRDAIVEIAVIRNQVQDGEWREEVLSQLVRPAGNIPKFIR